jgi:hypothetical protein
MTNRVVKLTVINDFVRIVAIQSMSRTETFIRLVLIAALASMNC